MLQHTKLQGSSFLDLRGHRDGTHFPGRYKYSVLRLLARSEDFALFMRDFFFFLLFFRLFSGLYLERRNYEETFGA